MTDTHPIYLDNQATTRCEPRALAAMLPFFAEEYGNPHSAEHAMGRRAEAAVEAARAAVAALIGAEAREIVFTSGATESNNIAIKGAARYARLRGDGPRRIVALATEHKCVLQSMTDLAVEGLSRSSSRWAGMGCSTSTGCGTRCGRPPCWSA